MLQGKVFEAQRDMGSMLMEFTASKVKNFLLGKDVESKTLLEVYNQHVEEVKALVGKEFWNRSLFKKSLLEID